MASHMQVPEEAPPPAAAIHGKAPVTKPLQPSKKADTVPITKIMGSINRFIDQKVYKSCTNFERLLLSQY